MSGPRWTAFTALQAWLQKTNGGRLCTHHVVEELHHDIVLGCEHGPIRFHDGGQFWVLSTILGEVPTDQHPSMWELLNAVHVKNAVDHWALYPEGELVWSMWSLYDSPPDIAILETAVSMAHTAAATMRSHLESAGIHLLHVPSCTRPRGHSGSSQPGSDGEPPGCR